MIQITCCRSCKRFSKELKAEKATSHKLRNRVMVAEGQLHFIKLDLEQVGYLTNSTLGAEAKRLTA